jgi:8-oxo-dGTP diphosphatase
VLYRDEIGRVLLVEPTYKDTWEIPGGMVEDNESPYTAAAREVMEELGLVAVPGRLLVVDWVPARVGIIDGLMFVFDGGELDAGRAEAIVLPSDELNGWAWCTHDEAQARLSPLLMRRVTAAVVAAEQGTTIYLEDGCQI